MRRFCIACPSFTKKVGDQVQAEAMAAETKALAAEDQRVSDLENAAAAAAKTRAGRSMHDDCRRRHQKARVARD